MFDFGCTVNHYCSDMTRTYFWGQPSAKQKKVYLDVLKAQELAVRKLGKSLRHGGASGLRGKDVDKVARDFLNKKYKSKAANGTR